VHPTASSALFHAGTLLSVQRLNHLSTNRIMTVIGEVFFFLDKTLLMQAKAKTTFMSGPIGKTIAGLLL